ncbi:MAG: hypothetical protein CVV21_10705 [Candidatus Goldiibacteriota bacterium HGW-Goldbacteria-1]|nr:MAG: hypothetical protein CVV21_10705 [Candidatus Goldiibacteriota bacterium HGW-Goldbacteria-1]
MKKIAAVCFILLFTVSSVFAYNKIRTKDMDWHIFETPHFKIYYYKSEELLAKFGVIYAEEAFEKITKILGYTPKEKIPLFIYENPVDFGTTNITLSYLGEGTGGFTEAYKNRVVLPANGSLKAFKEVLTHEITHAISFDILYGEGMRSYATLYKDLFMPLWVMEGLAEHCADDFDTRGEMVLRDAVINDRLVPLNKAEGFSHLEEVYLAYKEAQSAIDYIASKYGAENIQKFLKFYTDELSTEAVFRQILKKDFSQFEKEWAFYLKKKYWAQIQGRDEAVKYGPALTQNDHRNLVYNLAPSFSPDGSRIAYVSTKDGIKTIFIMKNDGTGIVRPFLAEFEGVDTNGNAISWSKDGKLLYFAGKKRGKMALFEGNVENGALKEYEIEGLDIISSPALSPDGRYIALCGTVSGFSDVYLYEPATGKLLRITDNVYENSGVSWSQDATALVFSEEHEGVNRLCHYELKSGVKQLLTTAEAGNCETPVFSAEKEIIFVSDKNGIFNLYSMIIDTKEIRQLTNVSGGVFSPSVSGDFIAYSYYEDGCYNIYKYLRNAKSDFSGLPLSYYGEAGLKKENSSDTAGITAAVQEPKTTGQDDLEFREEIESGAAELISENKKYTTAFSPDMIFAILGAGTDTGIIGAGYLQLSDMLGDHNIAVLLNAVPGYYTQFETQYLYMALPFDLSLYFFYNQNTYKLYDFETGDFFSRLDSTQAGATVDMKYPLTLYDSVGINFSSQRVSDRYTEINYSSGYEFDGDRFDIINVAALYYEHDTVSWRDMWPVSGNYFSLYVQAAEKMFGGTRSYGVYQAEFRKYFDLNFISGMNTVFASRAVAAMTDGDDKPYFVFGGINTLRGAGYGEFTGDKIGFVSAELRQTVAKNLNFKLWPLEWWMVKNIKTQAFIDSGLVKTGVLEAINEKEILSGAGVGVTIDTFVLQRQFMPMKFEVAKRIDKTDDIWKFYFSISTGY